MRAPGIIWLLLNILFLGGLVMVKAELIDHSLVSRTTAVSSVCMQGYFSLVILITMIWGGGVWISKGISGWKWKFILPGIFAIAIGFWHSGHWVVRDSHSIHEHFFLFRLQSAEYDMQLQQYNMEGYDKSFHDLSDYPCYEYCDNFFTRSYQVRNGEEFIVYKGIGPIFSLSSDEWTPQASSN